MPPLTQFDPPADISDFQQGSTQDKDFRSEWSRTVDRMTHQAIQNLPWAYKNQGTLTEYYDPLVTNIPSNAATAPIKWISFPNRILVTFPNASQKDQWKYADEGPPDVNGKPYTPTGPRGWQDEYCEWSVTRNSAGKITKVMFTCENREYWFSLWRESPKAAVAAYRALVGSQVQESDLYLLDSSGNPVIDRETGRPAYNDLNKWNNSTTDGAVHLVSNPNALSAEVLIAGQATIPRDSNGQPVTGGNALLACGPFGQPNRNSDPHISASVNSLVRAPSNLQVSLRNPVGLYIQTPDFSTFQLPFSAPSGAKPSDYWTIVRGKARSSPNDIDEILHAVYEVPASQGFVVGDITIDGFAIEYGSQINQKFDIALAGLGFPQSSPPAAAEPCVSDRQPPLPWPQQLIDLNLAQANSRYPLATRVAQGSTVPNLLLFASGADLNATVAFTGGTGVKATVTHSQAISGGQAFVLTVDVAATAPVGDRALLLTNANGAAGPAAVGMLEIVPAGSLAAAAPTAEALLAKPEEISLKALAAPSKARY